MTAIVETEKRKPKNVNYKGDTFILRSDQNVYGVNTKTGEVYEAQLKKMKQPWLLALGMFFRIIKRVTIYNIVEKPGHEYLPAFDLYKAKIKFKGYFGKTLKIKGL